MMSVSKVWLLVSLIGLVTACTVVALTTPADAAQKDVSLECLESPAVKVAQGGNPIGFNFTVQHTGELMSEEVYIRLKGRPVFWQHFLTSQTEQDTYSSTDHLLIVLKRDERAVVSLMVTPYMKELNDTFWMTLDACPKGEEENNQSRDIGVIIPQLAAFDISVHNGPPSGVFEAIPPSRLTLRFALYNTGNGVDRFLIEYESSRTDAGWTLTPTAGIDEYGWTTDVPPDRARAHPHLIDLAITIPSWERADVTCHVVVSATSLFDQGKQMPPAFAVVRSLQYFDFQVSIDGPYRRTASPGGLAEFKLRILNEGNGPDEFSIVPLWDPDLGQGFFATANPGSILITSNGTGTVTYLVKVPATAAKRAYFFSADVSSSSETIANITRSFEVDVAQSYGLQLEVAQTGAVTVPGDVLTFDVGVRNVGNSLDSVTVSLEGVPPSWYHYVQPAEVTLLQDELGTVSVRVIVPTEFDEAPIGAYVLTVVASSVRSDAVARCILNVTISQFHRIEWMYQGEPIDPSFTIKPRRSFNPYERNSIDIPLKVKNLGNGDDEVDVWGSAPHPLVVVTVTPERTLLKRDESRLVKVNIVVPVDLPPGVYSLWVNASSQDRTTRTRTVNLDFEVYNLDARVPPIPGSAIGGGTSQVMSEIKVNVGTNVTFELRIENTGTRPLNSVLLRACDVHEDGAGRPVRWYFFNLTTPPITVGDRFIVGRGSFPDASPMLTWHAAFAGPHTLEFEVLYDHQSRTDNDLSSVNVTVVAGPGVRPPPDALRFGVAAGVAISILIAIAYMYVLRARPALDRDLYSSIYGGEFEEPMGAIDGEAAPTAGAGPALTPEQQALYGDDYGADGEEDAYDEGGYED